MKKFITILSSVSIAALIGLSNIALADEKEDIKNTEEEEASPQQGRVLTDSDSNEDENDDDTPQGTGDPLKGLLGGKGEPCKPCDVPFGGTVSTGDDDEGDDDVPLPQKNWNSSKSNTSTAVDSGDDDDDGDGVPNAADKKDLPEQASDKAREATSKEKKKGKKAKKGKKDKKKDDDG